MNPTAIGAFHEQQINITVLLIKVQGRIINDRFAKSSQITTKSNGVLTTIFPRPDDRNGRPKNVTGVV